MKNLKFGVFCLGLVLTIGTAVLSLNAQSRMRVEAGRNLMVLDGRGSQLGVMVSDLDAKATTGGVQIDEVNEASPAEKAGIKSGDVIVEYDGERVRSARQFTRLVQETPEGRTVTIALLRDGKRQTVNATPESSTTAWNFGPEVDRAMREAERGLREFNFSVPPPEWRTDRAPRRFEYRMPGGMLPFAMETRGRLGVQVQSLTPDLEEYFGATNGGALVSSVAKDSAAAKAGVKAGDVITSINGRRVNDSDDLMREIQDAKGETTIVLLRDKKEMTVKAVIEENKSLSPQGTRRSRPGAI
jgi:serine protease Do